MLSELWTLPLDAVLSGWVAQYGAWVIALLAAIVFAETGFVVLPFLPGDSLLFLAGAVLSAHGDTVHVAALSLVLAAVAGDAVNFAAGRRAGPWVMRTLGGRWLRPSHLATTRGYFARFGASTIVVARFVPVVRSVAPFLAGVGDMPYRRFAVFNLAGAVAWVGLLVYAGMVFGSLPWVRDNLSRASLLIVGVSLVPIVAAALRARKERSA